MIGKYKAILVKYRGIISYLFFGVLTTVANYLVYLPCYNLMGFSAGLSNGIAWAFAVIFAYLTNKPFVFDSHDWSIETVLPEFGKFVGTRLFSGAAETVLLMAFVDYLGMNGNVWKLITSVLVVILNYVGSKLLVFRKQKT